MTLTHFLAEMISEKYPEVEGWENDLSHLKEGHKGFTFFFLKIFSTLFIESYKVSHKKFLFFLLFLISFNFFFQKYLTRWQQKQSMDWTPCWREFVTNWNTTIHLRHLMINLETSWAYLFIPQSCSDLPLFFLGDTHIVSSMRR